MFVCVLARELVCVCDLINIQRSRELVLSDWDLRLNLVIINFEVQCHRLYSPPGFCQNTKCPPLSQVLFYGLEI